MTSSDRLKQPRHHRIARYIYFSTLITVLAALTIMVFYYKPPFWMFAALYALFAAVILGGAALLDWWVKNS
jgi:hypothetical protein